MSLFEDKTLSKLLTPKIQVCDKIKIELEVLYLSTVKFEKCSAPHSSELPDPKMPIIMDLTISVFSWSMKSTKEARLHECRLKLKNYIAQYIYTLLKAENSSE